MSQVCKVCHYVHSRLRCPACEARAMQNVIDADGLPREAGTLASPTVLHTLTISGNVHCAVKACNELGLAAYVVQFHGGHPAVTVILRLTLEQKLELQAAGKL